MFEKLFAERGLSLDRLRVLVEIHGAGGIVQAAPGDPIRQSQYSRQLRELSEFFGCEVAQRRGKRLALTPRGAELAVMARAHLRSLEDFRSACRAEDFACTIAAGDSLIHWLVIPRLGRVRERVPPVRFTTANLRTNEVVRQLGDGRVDFGVIRKDALVEGMKSAPLGLLTYAVVVSPELVGRKSKLSLAEVLGKFPLTCLTTDGQFMQRLDEIAASLGVSVRVSLACDSFPQMLEAVLSGDYAAVLPEIALAGARAQKLIKVNAPGLAKLKRELVLAWNPRTLEIRAGMSKLRDALRNALTLG